MFQNNQPVKPTTMLHPNKAEHSQIHISKKKRNIFPSISFWKIPQLFSSKIAISNPPCPNSFFFLHQSNTGIKACVVVAALSQQLGVIIPPVGPALFIHHPACLGDESVFEMEKNPGEIHSKRPPCVLFTGFFV